MTFESDFSFSERVLFSKGQRLTAGDLTAAQDVNRKMLWLHNRSLHQWGIGAGMAVAGEKGSREVTIGPGFALDADGREIVLREGVTEPVPPLAGPTIRDLTIAYPADDEIETTETREGICLPGGAVRLSEVPRIRWLETAEVRTGFDIVLARATIRNCQLDTPLSLTPRRNARPPQQPRIYCGKTAEGGTDWKPWIEQILVDSQGGAAPGGEAVPQQQPVMLGFETEVDTSVAHFRTTPSYYARVAGRRLVTMNVDIPGSLLENSRTISFLVEGFPQVINLSPQGFTLQVLMAPRSSGLNPQELFEPNFRQKLQDALKSIWYVVWIGIEG